MWLYGCYGYPSANSDAPTNSLTPEMFHLLSRQVTPIETPLKPDILQHPLWQEDSTTDLHLSHVYLLFTLIYIKLICDKNKLFWFIL